MASDSSKSEGIEVRRDFTYNSLGLPVRKVTGTSTATYTYNRYGFPLFTPPYAWTRYDSLSRRIYYQYGQGATLQAILGYAYDSLSRLSEIRHLPPGYPMEAPGPPFNREVFRLDAKNRVVYKEAKLWAPPGPTMAMDSSRQRTTPQGRKFLNGDFMIWTRWKPSRPNNGASLQGRKRFAGVGPMGLDWMGIRNCLGSDTGAYYFGHSQRRTAITFSP